MSDFLGTAEVYKDTDYKLGEFPKAPNSYSGVMYNQADVAKYSCSIHGAMGAYTDQTGYVFTLDERKALWAKALALGAKENIGWYLADAVDLIRHFKNDTTTVRVNLIEQGMAALDAGYSLVVGFRGNKEYNADKNDGSLDNLTFGEGTYGHIVRMTKDKDLIRVVDNYKGSKNETYTIDPKNLGKLVLNRVFFTSAYLFIPRISDDMAKKAKIKGLQVSLKIAINQANRKINDLEKTLSTLEGREPKKYVIS